MRGGGAKKDPLKTRKSAHKKWANGGEILENSNFILIL